MTLQGISTNVSKKTSSRVETKPETVAEVTIGNINVNVLDKIFANNPAMYINKHTKKCLFQNYKNRLIGMSMSIIQHIHRPKDKLRTEVL